jgi:hypothetical protein
MMTREPSLTYYGLAPLFLLLRTGPSSSSILQHDEHPLSNPRAITTFATAPMDHSHHMEHGHMPDMDHGAMCSMNVRFHAPFPPLPGRSD